MDMSAAKNVVAKTDWTFHHGEASLGIGPHLQALVVPELSDAVKVLGVAVPDTLVLPTTGGLEFSFHRSAIDVLSPHIPNFAELKARDLAEKSLAHRKRAARHDMSADA